MVVNSFPVTWGSTLSVLPVDQDLSSPAVLPLLVAVAIALALLLVVLAIAVTSGAGRLGRLGVDRAAAEEGRFLDPGPRSATDRHASSRIPTTPTTRAEAEAGDPWREAGRRLTSVAAAG